jgi:hypothetical protein
MTVEDGHPEQSEGSPVKIAVLELRSNDTFRTQHSNTPALHYLD